MTARYSTRRKAQAVIAATLTSDKAASDATGIPARTIGRWRDDPDLSVYVTKTRDALAEEMHALAALAVATIVQDVRAGRFEPRDLVTLMGVATEKSLLLSGDATSRTETRDLTGTLSDPELIAAVREAEHLTRTGVDGAAPTTAEPSAD